MKNIFFMLSSILAICLTSVSSLPWDFGLGCGKNKVVVYLSISLSLLPSLFLSFSLSLSPLSLSTHYKPIFLSFLIFPTLSISLFHNTCTDLTLSCSLSLLIGFEVLFSISFQYFSLYFVFFRPSLTILNQCNFPCLIMPVSCLVCRLVGPSVGRSVIIS